ncbi:hypothetical protein N3930_14365, partial [Bacillus thuringiensis]|nr:hypothetical protein [Bacillus thuringiensis]
MQNFITVEDTNKKLEKGLEEIFKNDRFQHLLKVMSQFKGYSTFIFCFCGARIRILFSYCFGLLPI